MKIRDDLRTLLFWQQGEANMDKDNKMDMRKEITRSKTPIFSNRLKYAVGSASFVVGLFVFIMVVLEVYVLSIPFNIGGFQVKMIGFPWTTEQVADSTGWWHMANYSQQFPNVYFLNYGELLAITLFMILIGRNICNSVTNYTHMRSRASFLSLLVVLFGFALLLYLWGTMTVLWNTYVFGNTVYYPALTPPPTPSWITQFGLSQSIQKVPYSGGIYGFSVIPYINISYDALLYIAAIILFFSLTAFKYFGYIDNIIREEVQKN